MPPTDTAEQSGHQPRRKRQNPVSCRLCRLRKLKCNRQQPCSNCSARGVSCEYFVRNPGQAPTDGADQREAISLAVDNADFQARLKRLEEAVFSKQSERPSTAATTIQPIHGGASTTTLVPGFALNEEHEVTSRWLEGIGTLENPIFRACPANIALLLSILASASHMWRPQRSKCLIFLSAKEAASMSLIWSNATLDMLEYSKRNTAASIEDLQATIVISYVIYNSHGFSPMFRSLHSNIIMMARDLSLHMTDSPQRKARTDPPPTYHEVDIKRRLWWHVAATDWLLAFTPGPQEGTYSIQPLQMHVNQPQYPDNCDSGAGSGLLLSTSHFLQRIRLAEICRAVVDSLSPFGMVDKANYEQVILLDGKFDDLITSLPLFFQLDGGTEFFYNAPQLTLQRYLIHLGIYTRRSRLHQPFVVAGFTNSKYSFSRNACLNCSRAVLQICYRLEEKKDDLELIPARLATVVHHVFMAAVVLLMDLCSNKMEELEGQRQEEVNRACKMLDGLKHDSAMAAKLAHPLMEILQRHRQTLEQSQSLVVPLTVAASSSDGALNQITPDPSVNVHGPLLHTVNQHTPTTAASAGGRQPAGGTEHEEQPGVKDWEFDSVMQDYIDFGQNIDGNSWLSLFDDLDSHHTNFGGAAFSG